MATEQDAARERVLAARAEFADQLEVLEASGRAAIDIPAKIRRSPEKAAAIVGGAGFLALKGPQRLFGAARRMVTGKAAPMPKRMLPAEIEKTLRKLGHDGDRVRGTLERDFAAYAKQTEKDRKGLASVLLLTAARPLLERGAKAAGEFFLTPDAEGLAARLAQVRARAGDRVDEARHGAAEGVDSARERAVGGVQAIRGRAADGVETVRERTAEGVDTVRGAAHEGADRVRDSAERAKDAAQGRIASARNDQAGRGREPHEDAPTGN